MRNNSQKEACIAASQGINITPTKETNAFVNVQKIGWKLIFLFRASHEDHCSTHFHLAAHFIGYHFAQVSGCFASLTSMFFVAFCYGVWFALDYGLLFCPLQWLCFAQLIGFTLLIYMRFVLLNSLIRCAQFIGSFIGSFISFLCDLLRSLKWRLLGS